MNKLFLLLIVLSAGCASVSRFEQGEVVCAQLDTVSFTTTSGLIIVEAEINGFKGRFLYDNGFSLSALDPEFVKRLGNDFKGKLTVRDANNKSTSLRNATIEEVKIGDFVFNGTHFIEIETENFLPCDSLDGVIGAAIINKANWSINFEKQRMAISCVPFVPSDSAVVLDITYNYSNGAFVQLNMFGEEIKGYIDLGNSSDVDIQPEKIKPHLNELLVEERLGINSLSGTGLGNSDTTRILKERVPVFIDSVELKPALTELKKSSKYDAYLGVGYFNQYHLIMNSTESKFYLDERVVPKELQEELTYGIAIYKVNEDFVLIRKDLNDPNHADIPLMSKVIAINGRKFSELTICEYQDFVKALSEEKRDLVLLFEDNKMKTIPYRAPYYVPFKFSSP